MSTVCCYSLLCLIFLCEYIFKYLQTLNCIHTHSHFHSHFPWFFSSGKRARRLSAAFATSSCQSTSQSVQSCVCVPQCPRLIRPTFNNKLTPDQNIISRSGSGSGSGRGGSSNNNNNKRFACFDSSNACEQRVLACLFALSLAFSLALVISHLLPRDFQLHFDFRY